METTYGKNSKHHAGLLQQQLDAGYGKGLLELTSNIAPVTLGAPAATQTPAPTIPQQGLQPPQQGLLGGDQWYDTVQPPQTHAPQFQGDQFIPRQPPQFAANDEMEPDMYASSYRNPFLGSMR